MGNTRWWLVNGCRGTDPRFAARPRDQATPLPPLGGMDTVCPVCAQVGTVQFVAEAHAQVCCACAALISDAPLDAPHKAEPGPAPLLVAEQRLWPHAYDRETARLSGERRLKVRAHMQKLTVDAYLCFTSRCYNAPRLRVRRSAQHDAIRASVGCAGRQWSPHLHFDVQHAASF